MVKRFRMIAGPNGSGKSTLVKRLHDDYSVNFYTFEVVAKPFEGRV